MEKVSFRYPALLELVLPKKLWLRHTLALTFGIAALTLAAKFKIPFYPVPQTMQVAVVLLLAVAYGRFAWVTIGSYMALGAGGLPVFSGTPERGLGLAYMAGPTGGYLAGMVLASLVLGYMVTKLNLSRSWKKAGLLLVGIVLIYVPGVTYLSVFTGWGKVWGLGVTPFLGADLLKAGLVLLIWPNLEKSLRPWLKK